MAPVEWNQDRLTDEEMVRLHADLLEAEAELESEMEGESVMSAPVAWNEPTDEELDAIHVGLAQALAMLETEMERRGLIALLPMEQNDSDLTNSEIDEILEQTGHAEHMEQMREAAREQELLAEFAELEEAQRYAEEAWRDEMWRDFEEEQWQEREARGRVNNRDIVESEDNRKS